MKTKFNIGDKVTNSCGVSFVVDSILISEGKISYFMAFGSSAHPEETLELFVESKPKVKMYLYAYKHETPGETWVSVCVYKDDEHFKKRCAHVSWFQRLDWSMTEVEE